MPKTSQNDLPAKRFDPSRDNMGNKNASLPYDEKLIRDSLKVTIYRAVRGLAMPLAEAAKYYDRPDVTILETMFWEAMDKRNWDVLERFFNRTIGAPAIKQLHEISTNTSAADLTKLTQDELDQLRNIHAKLAADSAK